MKDCEAYTELISAAVDGALSPEEQVRLEAHLAQCPHCRALLEDLTALHAVLADLPPVEPPVGLKEQIMDAIEKEKVISMPQAKKKSVQPWKRYLASAAVLAVVLAGGYGIRQTIDGRSSTSAAAPEAASVTAEEPASGEVQAEAAADRSGELATDSAAAAAPAEGSGTAVQTEEAASVYALTLVVDRVSADSGYQRTLTWGTDSCDILLTQADGTVVDESTVTYEGLSENGKYYLFSWSWEGQTEEDAELFRYAVPLEGDTVIWRGESSAEGFDGMISQ
jgi:hypothetical protein